VIILSLMQNVVHSQLTSPILRATFTLLLVAAPFAPAQTPLSSKPAADVIAANIRFELPDSPGTFFTSSSSSADPDSLNANSPDPAASDPNGAQTPPSGPRPKAAAHWKFVVNPGEVAQPMTVRDKVLGGMANSVSLFSAAGWLAAAGWEQLLNSSPNYGTDSGAFGQRLANGLRTTLRTGQQRDDLAAVLFLQLQRFFECIGIGLVDLIAEIVFIDPVTSRVDAQARIPDRDLFDGDDDLHTFCAPFDGVYRFHKYSVSSISEKSSFS